MPPGTGWGRGGTGSSFGPLLGLSEDAQGLHPPRTAVALELDSELFGDEPVDGHANVLGLAGDALHDLGPRLRLPDELEVAAHLLHVAGGPPPAVLAVGVVGFDPPGQASV